MPLPFKLLLSGGVILVSALVIWWEAAGPQSYLGWIVAAIGAIMLLGLWVFPEAGGGKRPRDGGR